MNRKERLQRIMDAEKRLAEGQWTLSVPQAHEPTWAVIGWDDLVARLREMDLADAMVKALRASPESEPNG